MQETSRCIITINDYCQQKLNFTLDFPALAAATSEGTISLSPGPNILLGRIQHVRSPSTPFALMTNASASAFVAE